MPTHFFRKNECCNFVNIKWEDPYDNNNQYISASMCLDQNSSAPRRLTIQKKLISRPS